MGASSINWPFSVAMVNHYPSGKSTVCELEHGHRNSEFSQLENGDLSYLNHSFVRSLPEGIQLRKHVSIFFGLRSAIDM